MSRFLADHARGCISLHDVVAYYRNDSIKSGSLCCTMAQSIDVWTGDAYYPSHRCSLQQNGLLAFRLCQHRGSRYRPNFQEPIVDKDVLAVALPPDDPRLFSPIKAALDNMCPHVFNDPVINKFINVIMVDGQKLKARNIVFSALERVKRMQVKKLHRTDNVVDRTQIECNPQVVFHKALENCMPLLYLKRVIRGGITYQIPCPISEQSAQFRAMQWMRDVCREKERTVHMDEALAKEMLAAFHNDGRVVKKKQELHRTAEANRAFAHYKWT